MDILLLLRMACTHCSSVLGKYAKSSHANMACPVLKYTYCNICSVYEHSPSNCIKLKCLEDTDPIADKNISLVKSPYTANMVKLTNADSSVRIALIANEIVPMTCQEKGKKIQRDFIENKKRLMNFLKQKGMTLVLMNPKNKTL